MQFVLQLQVLSITHSTPSKMRKKNGEYVSHRCCQKFLHEITASGELTYVKCSLHHLSLLHSGSILIFHFKIINVHFRSISPANKTELTYYFLFSLSLTDFAKPNKIHFFNDGFSHFRISSLHLFQFQFFLTKATRTVSSTPDKVLAKVCTMLTILSSLLEILCLVEPCTCLLDTYII